MRILINCLAVGVGGFLGALARLGVAAAARAVLGAAFPFGTLFINLSGSFLLGWFLARVARGVAVSEPVLWGFTVGFLGAYTTFSTFMYESDLLIRDGAMTRATLNLVGSLVLGLIAVRVGVLAGARF